MACFSLSWIEQICIWLVVVFAIVAIIRLIVPLIGAPLGVPVGGIINIICWAIVAILAIYIVFALLSCLLSGPGLPLIHR